jgi:hypothetical protein
MVMFDFSDVTTPEYQSFVNFVDIETNIPRKIAEIDRAVIPYQGKNEVEPFRSFQMENLLTKEECEYLIWLAESTDEWLVETIPFWKHRNLPFLSMLPERPWATEETYPLCIDIVTRIWKFIEDSFWVDVYPDQIGLVRWLPGSWQMVHKDDVDGLDRVSGCVVFLNDDYEGGEPFYPYYDKMVKPKAGMVYAHSSNEDHLHGVTQIRNKTRYTISTTWTTNKDKSNYLGYFSNHNVMKQSNNRNENGI